jgi:hypothetical protein
MLFVLCVAFMILFFALLFTCAFFFRVFIAFVSLVFLPFFVLFDATTPSIVRAWRASRRRLAVVRGLDQLRL